MEAIDAVYTRGFQAFSRAIMAMADVLESAPKAVAEKEKAYVAGGRATLYAVMTAFDKTLQRIEAELWQQAAVAETTAEALAAEARAAEVAAAVLEVRRAMLVPSSS